MSRDYEARFCREETLADTAAEWRRAGGIDYLGYFDITEFIEETLSRRFSRKGALKIVFFESSDPDELAYVTYKPTVTLNVDSETWKWAKLGDPLSRFILAHEIGHIILHDHYLRQFSNDPALNIPFSILECSAEWQANTFAGYFLLPDHIVQSFAGAERLAGSCAVPTKLAQERTAAVLKVRFQSKTFAGEACRKCGNFTLVREGTCLKCDTCGATTGCS
jgi:hypothetical protein